MASHAEDAARSEPAVPGSATIRVGIITVSDKASRGERQDEGGPTIRDVAVANGWTVDALEVVPDERGQIAEQIRAMADERESDLVFTTGGTGLSPRDVTPQATQSVLDYEVPGLAEAMRAASISKTPAAMTSRAVAGVRGRTLVVNLPGNPKGVRECLEAILPALPHAVGVMRGDVGEHNRPASGG